MSQLAGPKFKTDTTPTARVERTPGMAAVSGAYEGTGPGQFPGPGLLTPPIPSQSHIVPLVRPKQIQTENSEDNTQENGYIVHWNSLVSLLQPAHPYFHDKQAEIAGFMKYTREDDPTGRASFLFPKIKSFSKGARHANPYRRYQLARSHAGRTVSQLSAVVKNNALDDFRQLDLVLTIPSDVSAELAVRSKRGISCAWSIFQRFWKQLPDVLGIPGDCAGLVNLHLWKTEEPLSPHFHFHIVILNHYRDSQGHLIKWFGKSNGKSYIDKSGREKIGYVPLSDDELVKVKTLWTSLVRASCKRNQINCQYLKNKSDTLNIYVDFVPWDEKARFIHKVSYQRRHWVEDYVRYTETHPDCDNPPEWLENYSNASRAFGWWKQFKQFSGDEEVLKEDKIDILSGKKLKYVGKLENNEVLSLNLFCYDAERGHPIIEPLNDDDVAWLRRVCLENLYDKYAREEVLQC